MGSTLMQYCTFTEVADARLHPVFFLLDYAYPQQHADQATTFRVGIKVAKVVIQLLLLHNNRPAIQADLPVEFLRNALQPPLLTPPWKLTHSKVSSEHDPRGSWA